MILIADSGGTKADWWLTAAHEGGAGQQLRTQGINPFHQDEAQITSILYGELLPQLSGAQPMAVYFYGSGCRPEHQPLMQRLIASAIPSAQTVEAQSDLLGAARAVCGRVAGQACILGTGANSCLYDGTAIVQNTPPLGYVLGDEGSGAVLGIRFLNALYRGFLPAAVAEELEHELRLSMTDVIDRVYRQPMANRFLASLSPFIHARLYVPEVRALVVDGFRLFFRRNMVQYGRRDLPVGAVGSVAYNYEEQLREAARAEGFTVDRVLQSPIAALADYHTS